MKKIVDACEKSDGAAVALLEKLTADLRDHVVIHDDAVACQTPLSPGSEETRAEMQQLFSQAKSEGYGVRPR